MNHPDFLTHLIFWGKVAGAITSISGFAWLVFKWFRAVTETSSNVNLLMSNHLPHIQSSLDAHGTALQGIKSDVRDMGTQLSAMGDRVSDTRAAVHVLGEKFIDHIDKGDKIPKRRRK